ncbi:MAG: hypothetical protein AAFY17_10730 [Cyanobacteria bacterium J06642_11]
MGSVPFANNWAYLDTELGWLERILLVTVSQQKKNLKSVTRTAKTSADKATSDWWQGLITLTHRAYDDVAPKASKSPSQGYQKTLDQRIMLSRANKVCLGLPAMQTALGLTLFEKQLVLMALAPEVQVRYGKLYHYLQTGTHCSQGALPTVDLALRVLCRNEAERRRARARLSGPDSLIGRRVLKCVGESSTLLTSQLQLSAEWVDYLLAEKPDPSWPMKTVMQGRVAQRCRKRLPWSDLVVADSVKAELETAAAPPASKVLLVGPLGVGKETVAIALATHLKRHLFILDLAQIPQSAWIDCFQELTTARYSMVLIKSAHHWLGRTASIETAQVHQWLSQSSAHIICTVQHRHLVRRHWRQQFTTIDIPNPNTELRLRLWKQVFTSGVKSMGKVRWHSLADGLELLPGEIANIGQTTTQLAGQTLPTLNHLQQALDQHGHRWQLR